MTTNARVFPAIAVGRPSSGTGIQRTAGRDQPFTVWYNYLIDGFEETLEGAYGRLQRLLDGRGQ